MLNWLGKGKWVILGSVILGIVIWAYRILAQEAQPASSGIKIGVVNIAEVFNKYKRREQFTNALEKEKKEEEIRIKDMENQIRELKKQIEVMDPDSELRMEKESQVKILSMQLEDRIKRWNRRINIKVNEQTALLYNEIRECIDKYARQNGFAIVFKVDPSLEKDPEENATLRINIRSIIYYDPSIIIDLTEEIIKALNK